MTPRFRSNYNIKTESVKAQTLWLNCSGPSTWTDYPANHVTHASINGDEKVMFDWVVPRFKQRSAKGEVFFNNRTIEKVTIETNAGGNWSQQHKNPQPCSPTPRTNEFKHTGPAATIAIPTSSHHRYGVWPIEVTGMSSSEVIRMQTLASTAVLSKRGRSDSDLWESLAEWKQTMNMLNLKLSELAKKADNLLTNIQRSRASRQLLKEVSTGYLLKRYGVDPLLKDIASIMKTFERQVGKQRKTSRANEQQLVVNTTSGYTDYGATRFNWTREVRENVVVRGMCLDEVDLNVINNIGFSLKGLLTVPYELMSYSFVADWIANIGDFIGATAPSAGYNLLGSALTTNTAKSTLYTFTGTQSPLAGLWISTSSLSGSIAVVRESSTRSRLRDPAVEFRTDFKFSSFTRSADLVALIAQRFTKINNLVGPVPVGMTYRQKQKTLLWLNQPGVI